MSWAISPPGATSRSLSEDGMLSALIVFFNIDGGIMFKEFVGRDDKRALKSNQLAAFRALAERLCSG
jgi:putative heme iron utilization protein